MSTDYPPTAVPFGSLRLPELRDPVLAGPGIDGLGTAATTYRDLADLLDKAAGDLRVALRSGQDGHDGATAEVVRRFVDRVAAAGELGAGQARIVVDALDDSAAYYARVRDDLNALPEIERMHDPRQRTEHAIDVEANRVLAIEASDRYERNANYTQGRVFQVFDVPLVDNPDAGMPVAPAGSGGAGPGSTGGFGGTGPVLSTVAGGAVPGISGTGLGPGGAGLGVPGAGVVPGGVGPGGAGPDGRASGWPGGSGAGVPGSAGGAGSGVGGPGGPGAAGFPGGVVPVGSAPGRGDRRVASLVPASESPLDGRLPGGGTYPDGKPGSGGVPVRPDPHAVPSSGWVPGQPWSSRNQTGGFAGVDEPPAGQGNGRPSTTTGTNPAGAPVRGAGATGLPFFPGGAGAGQGQSGSHPRPAWLLEDDPQAFWFANLPPHGPAVIGGSDPPPA